MEPQGTMVPPPPPPPSQRKNKERPIAITVICVLGFIGVAIAIPFIFSDTLREQGGFFQIYSGLSAVIGLACMVGLWNMKKWAAYTYAGIFVINQIILLTIGGWSILSFIIPAILVGIALAYLKQMD